MLSIIIVFPKAEDGKGIKNALIRSGYDVHAVVTTGAQAISLANELDEGIVICGYKFSDMQYLELYNYLPRGFQMLLVASKKRLEECMYSEIICLSVPMKTRDLLDTLEMMTYNYRRKKKRERDTSKKRTKEQKEVILKAKVILMERNHLSEEEAHRYIQKTSMDSGTNMVETAEMILSIMLS